VSEDYEIYEYWTRDENGILLAKWYQAKDPSTGEVGHWQQTLKEAVISLMEQKGSVE
jgi:hypothetical protein